MYCTHMYQSISCKIEKLITFPQDKWKWKWTSQYLHYPKEKQGMGNSDVIINYLLGAKTATRNTHWLDDIDIISNTHNRNNTNCPPSAWLNVRPDLTPLPAHATRPTITTNFNELVNLTNEIEKKKTLHHSERIWELSIYIVPCIHKKVKNKISY